MLGIIKKIGGRKVVLFLISLIAGIVFPKQATFIAALYGIYCGGNGVVSLSMNK